MADNKSKKSKRRRTTEAKLLITAASVAATLSGLAMFASQHKGVLAQTPVSAVVAKPGTSATDNFVPVQAPDTQEQAPSVESTPVPAPPVGRTRGSRGQRSFPGQQTQPNSMGTTRSSR
ncbi:MAG: hypothetical protein ABIQ44_05615 [Chloroflexia bacterium]